MSFTFYGDLLGISNTYKLDPAEAHKKLDTFYNTTFFSIDEDWEFSNNVHTIMMSDSLLMTGDASVKTALEQLHWVYTKLLYYGLLLRGAIVRDKLQFEYRITRENFKKFLPQDNTLAKAAGLEGTQKGARLLMEPELARDLLYDEPEWLTQEGYVSNVLGRSHTSYESPLRRVSPTPDSNCYEFLYFWTCHSELNNHCTDYRKKRYDLNQIKKMVGKDLGVHYKETINLLSRCESRHSLTDKYFNVTRPVDSSAY